jgi:hypothetical protein
MPRTLPIEAEANLRKAREAALLAVETYNRPGTTFRSAGYIVLMVVAWTALFHAIFGKKRVKPYYRQKQHPSRFERVDGDFKCWELSECVQQYYKDQNPAVRKNLEFIIKLRNKIEHRFLPSLDLQIFGECQALLSNFETLMCEAFGNRHALSANLALALQFARTVHPSQQTVLRGAAKRNFQSVRKFVETFRSTLSDDVLADQNYSFKVFLIPKVGASRSADDVAVEFVKYDPSKPEEMSKYNKVVALIKPKQVNVINATGLRAGEVVSKVAAKLGGKKFNQSRHTQCWHHFKARPAKGAADPSLCNPQFCSYDAVHKDYVYTPQWVDFLVGKLSDPATYAVVLPDAAAQTPQKPMPPGKSESLAIPAKAAGS